MYCDPKCRAWNSRAWLPEGMTTRDDVDGEIERQKRAGAQIEWGDGDHHDDVLSSKAAEALASPDLDKMTPPDAETKDVEVVHGTRDA